MAIPKLTLAIFFIISCTNAETWQQKYDRLSQTPNSILSIYHDFSLAEGETPKSELSKLMNSLFGVTGSTSEDAWFEFQLGDSSAFGTETQEFLAKSEEELFSDLTDSINQLYDSKVNGVEDPVQLENNNAQKKELLLSIFNEAVELAKGKYARFLFHQLNKYIHGQIKNLDVSPFYSAFSDVVMTFPPKFNGKFNKKSGIQHVYTEKDGQKVFENQAAYDSDMSKFESSSELNKLIPELLNHSFSLFPTSDAKYLEKYQNVLANFENYLKKENTGLLEAAKVIKDERLLGELESRASDLFTKQMRYFKVKKGWNTFDNQFSFISQYYSESIKQESKNSEFFNRQILPTILAAFFKAFESQFEPSSLAKTETLKKIRKLVMARGQPSTVKTAFMNKVNLLERESESGRQSGLRRTIDHLNLVWEFKESVTYNEHLQAEIIGNCQGLFSLDASKLKRMISLNKVFYDFVVPVSESTTEFYQALYGIVLDFVTSEVSSDSNGNLKADFLNFLNNYVSTHDQTSQFYFSLLFNGSSLVDGEHFGFKLLQLSSEQAQSNADFIESTQSDTVERINYLNYHVLGSHSDKDSLSTIIKNLSGKEIDTSNFSVFGKRILL